MAKFCAGEHFYNDVRSIKILEISKGIVKLRIRNFRSNKVLTKKLSAARFHNFLEKHNYKGKDLDKRKSLCDCGAAYTSFPNQHYDWCRIAETT